MPRMFKSKAANWIPYIYMYSTFKSETTEDCFAFILMPSSPKRGIVSLQSIQFDFNVRGEVLLISFFYSGHELDVQKKARETMEGIEALKQRYGRGQELCVFNKKSNTLKQRLIKCHGSLDYLSDNIDFIKDTYHMRSDFANDIKSQLLNPDYLAHEYIRLRGKVRETGSNCVIM